MGASLDGTHGSETHLSGHDCADWSRPTRETDLEHSASCYVHDLIGEKSYNIALNECKFKTLV